ncbi:MAG: roadblock/LC7 domain-containing protein [Acidiferrobacter sp.]
MAKVDLSSIQDIDGFIAAALGDSSSGMLLARAGNQAVDLDLAIAGNSEVVNTKRALVARLNLDDKIEDILITLGKQYHLIRPLERNDKLFLYLMLDRAKANLAMARHELRTYEKTLDFS